MAGCHDHARDAQIDKKLDMEAGMALGRKTGGRKPGSRNKATPEEKLSVTELAKAYAPQALQTLADVMQNGSSESARVSAANAILDRAYGKVKEAQADDADAPATAVKIEINAPVGDVRVTRSDA